MATKISQDIAYILLHEHKYHNLIDVYLILAKLSCEKDIYNGKIFIISSYNKTRYNLAKTIFNGLPAVKSIETVITSLKRLEELDLLDYSELHKAWTLKHLEEFYKKEGGGYVELSEVLFSNEYYQLPYLEKKIIFYSLYLMAKKGFKKFKQLQINLINNDSDAKDATQIKDKFKLLFNTDNIYYLRNRFRSVIEKFFADISEFKRELELKKRAFISKYQENRFKNKLKFKFFYKKTNKVSRSISRRKPSSKDSFKEYRKLDPMFFGYLQKISRMMQDHMKGILSEDIQLQLLRQCAAMDYQSKQKITAKITYQLEKGTKFISPAKYIQTTIDNYMLEQCI